MTEVSDTPELYIAYILNLGEEYVVGVHKWVMYTSILNAIDSLTDTWLSKTQSRYTYSMDTIPTKLEIGEHKFIMRFSIIDGGYIARVA
jgi:hypothetical protein